MDEDDEKAQTEYDDLYYGLEVDPDETEQQITQGPSAYSVKSQERK